MVSPRKIHEWLLKALEEPFFQAEMHRVEVLLKKGPENEDRRRKERKRETATNQEDRTQQCSRKKARFTTLSGKVFNR